MLRAIISSFLRSTKLCLQFVVYCTDDAACSSESSGPSRFRPSGMNSMQMTVNIGGITLTGGRGERTCPGATLCTTNLIHTRLVSNPELHREITASDRLSHCMAV